MKRYTLVAVLIQLILAPCAVQSQDPYVAARKSLVKDRIATAGVTNARVLQSIETTLRHQFIPEQLRSQAYFDMALPIGDAQTISSPFIVAHMTEVLDPQPSDIVLEIGTGSGYQAAVLSPLVKEVYTIEIVEQLGIQAAKTLKRLGYDNVHAKVGDGFKGWPDAAPFDKIIVTCSPESVPKPLIEQLREGGRMVIPVGERYQQTLYLMRKKDGKVIKESLRPTLFVPMTGVAENNRVKQPDPENPSLINGDFSMQTDAEGHIPGWYYGRQASLDSDTANDNYMRFDNRTKGRDAHLLQGLGIDGRVVTRIRLGCRVRTRTVRSGGSPDSLPALAITFFDDSRRDLGSYGLGPYIGTRDWITQSRSFRVPPTTREAIIRIGLFGATGTADFDSVTLSTER